MSAKLTLELPNETIVEVTVPEVDARLADEDDPWFWLGYLSQRMRETMEHADEDERVNA